MNELEITYSNNKVDYKKLFWSILLDGVGYLSYLLPFLGEFTDILWAPVSSFLLMRMYKGTAGKIGGTVNFIEELLPGFDFIPSFTLTWIYTQFLSKNKK